MRSTSSKHELKCLRWTETGQNYVNTKINFSCTSKHYFFCIYLKIYEAPSLPPPCEWTRTQSLFMCFWGERRLGLGWGKGRIMGRDLTPILSPQKHMNLVTAYQSACEQRLDFPGVKTSKMVASGHKVSFHK